MYENVLFATDGSDNAMAASEHAIDIAGRYEATLHAISVIETRTGYDNAIIDRAQVRKNLEKIGSEALEDVRQRASERGVQTVTTIEEGVPATRILEYSEDNDIDMIIVGEKGHSAFKTVLLGSTTEAILHGSDVPVTVV